MHIHYHTFGCKVNQYETENIRQAMEADCHTSVNNLEESDVCIINTCTVTHEADRKLIQLVNRIKRVNPKAIIVMCGCYSQINENANKLADIVVGTSNKSRIPQLVAEYNSQKTAEVLPHHKGEPFETMANIGSARKTRAVIKIQDGCDRFCTYCIIPYARGRARSKPINEIEAEAKALVKAGHKELDLVGINLSCYGQDLGLNLADAVERVCKTSGAKRVRLGSLEAELIDEKIIERLAKLNNFCPHFHLSLQSGCDKTLREMGRKYDKAEYFTIVNNIRKYFPDCAITTDIMVGFPGETDDDFSESLEFVKTVKFADGHIFPYSPREGTLAAKRNDQVEQDVKNQRAEIMSGAICESRKAFLAEMVGKRVKVLFEKEKDSEWHIGHTENYVVVKVKHFTDTLRYEIKNVTITDTDGNICYGEISD